MIDEIGYRLSMIVRSLNFKKIKLLGVLIGDIINIFLN